VDVGTFEIHTFQTIISNMLWKRGNKEASMASEESLEILPGTEVMKDHDGIHFIHAQNAAQGPILIPIPSDNAHDPLVRFYLCAALLLTHFEKQTK
jgi:hypothetical protein